jgi:hypothetical protein
MNELKVGDYDEAHFKYEKKKFKGGVTCYGEIKDMDGKYVLFVDNDEFPYLVRKDKFLFVKKIV